MGSDVVTVSPADRGAVEDHLRRFAGDGAVAATGDRVEATVGGASFAVAADGTVEASMPLHAFHATGVTELVFDHDRGAVGVATPDGSVCYEFRRPG